MSLICHIPNDRPVVRDVNNKGSCHVLFVPHCESPPSHAQCEVFELTNSSVGICHTYTYMLRIAHKRRVIRDIEHGRLMSKLSHVSYVFIFHIANDPRVIRIKEMARF